MESNEINLIDNGKKIALFRGYIYKKLRTNKDQTKNWKCVTSNCKGSITTFVDDTKLYTIKVNAKTNLKHISKEFIAQAHSHPMHSKTQLSKFHDDENSIINEENDVTEIDSDKENAKSNSNIDNEFPEPIIIFNEQQNKISTLTEINHISNTEPQKASTPLELSRLDAFRPNEQELLVQLKQLEKDKNTIFAEIKQMNKNEDTILAEIHQMEKNENTIVAEINQMDTTDSEESIELLETNEMDTTDQNEASIINNEKDSELDTKFETTLDTFKIHLKNVKSSGEFSSGGQAKTLPFDMGLSVEDIGPIKFPLNKSQAEQLIQKCTQAPFGLKEKTLLDKSVRDTLQLDPSLIKISNPIWNTGIKELVSNIRFELGCSGEIEAVPYKFLLYKTGGHFKKHKDTEKEKSMFGTLIVQLPSDFTGGQLNVYKKNEKKSYNFGSLNGDSSKFVHYAAHYADLEHEVEPIKSGYRVCLIYSLCLVNANTNPLNVPKTVIEGMKSTLNVMNEYSYDMAILLDHKYTGRSIETTGIKALKGVDNDRFRLLNSANEKLPEDKQVVFYIAHANLVIDTYEITGYYEEIEEFGYRPRRKPKWEENERSVSIETIYDLKGAKKFENTTVDLEFFDTFIHPGRRDDADLNSSKAWGKEFDEDIHGWAGNEGMNRTLTYHKFLLVCWPKHCEFETLLKMDFKSAVDLVYNKMNEKSAEDPIFLKQFESLLVNLNTSSSSLTHSLPKLIRILSLILHEKFTVTLLTKIMPRNIYDKTTFKLIATLLNFFDKEAAKIILKKILGSRRNSFNDVHLINGLYELPDKTIAEFYFNESIVPILKNKIDYNTVPLQLLGTILKFTKNQQANLESFVKYIQKVNSSVLFQNELINNYPSQCSVKPLLDLVMPLVNDLRKKVDAKPVMYEIKDAEAPDQVIQAFLRSSEREKAFYGMYNKSRHGSMFNKIKKTYDVDYIMNGSGKSTDVTMVKSEKLYESQMKEWNKNNKELNAILRKLKLKLK